MMVLLQSMATEAVAVTVFGSATCRLAGMHLVTYHGVRHRASWVLVYLLMMIGPLVTVYEVLQGRPSWAALLLLGAVWMYLWQSRHTWREGPPAYMRVLESQPLPEPFGLAAGQARKEPK